MFPNIPWLLVEEASLETAHVCINHVLPMYRMLKPLNRAMTKHHCHVFECKAAALAPVA